jgi:hypothetical protein
MNTLYLAGESADDASGHETCDSGQAEASVAYAVQQAKQSLLRVDARPGFRGAQALMPAVVVSVLFSHGMHCSDAGVPDPGSAMTDSRRDCRPACASRNVANAVAANHHPELARVVRQRVRLHRMLQDQLAMRDVVMERVQWLQQACAHQRCCIRHIRAMQQGMRRLHNSVVSLKACKEGLDMWVYPQAVAAETLPVADKTSVSATSTWSKLHREGLL